MFDPDFRRRLASRLISGARSRAARRGLSFTIGPEDVERMLIEQDMRCAVSRLDFSFKDYPAIVRHPFGPSIDRKSSKKGYDPSNVRLVCAAANIGLGQWGDEVFLAIARGAVDTANAALAANSSTPPTSLQERLDAASDLMESADRHAQARRVAALKRAVTLGPRVCYGPLIAHGGPDVPRSLGRAQGLAAIRHRVYSFYGCPAR